MYSDVDYYLGEIIVIIAFRAHNFIFPLFASLQQQTNTLVYFFWGDVEEEKAMIPAGFELWLFRTVFQFSTTSAPATFHE